MFLHDWPWPNDTSFSFRSSNMLGGDAVTEAIKDHGLFLVYLIRRIHVFAGRENVGKTGPLSNPIRSITHRFGGSLKGYGL